MPPRASLLFILLAFLGTAGLNIVASQQVDLSSGSAFLDLNMWRKISRRTSVQCKWTVHTSDGVTQADVKYPINAIFEALQSVRSEATNHTWHQRPSEQHIHLLESHGPSTHIDVPAASPGGRSVKIYNLEVNFLLYTIEGILCAEMMLATKLVNVVLPFQEEIEYIYLHKHSPGALERLFRGAAILVPPAETITLFHDKKLFADWMESNNMSYLLPTVYKSAEEVVYPAVIKATTKTGGRGVIVVKSRRELDDEINNFGNQSYIIEEAISGEIEVIQS